MFKEHKHLLIFTVINYFDKFIAFVLPLLILHFIKDVALYNNIEYVFSIASIIVVIAELGTSSFLLYSYKSNTEKRPNYIEEIRGNFFLLFIIYSLISAFIFALSFYIAFINVILPFICIRVLTLYFTTFSSIYYRLRDKPAYVLYYSIGINVSTIIITYLCFKYLKTIHLMHFFVTQIIFSLLIVGKGLKYLNIQKAKILLNYVYQALSYSWPLILNVLLLTFINNYGKIYAFNYLSKIDMYNFSYIMRLAMIIQMAHSSVVAYYAKALYLDSVSTINRKIYWIYLLFLVSAILLVLAILTGINFSGLFPKLHMGILPIVLLLYIFMWCQVAYFEQYLSRLNKNKMILLFSFTGSLVYIVLLILNKDITLTYISISMLISILINLSGVLIYMKKLKLIKL